MGLRGRFSLEIEFPLIFFKAIDLRDHFFVEFLYFVVNAGFAWLRIGSWFGI